MVQGLSVSDSWRNRGLQGKLAQTPPCIPPGEADSVPVVSEKQQTQPRPPPTGKMPRLLSGQGAVPAPHLHPLNHALKDNLLLPFSGAAKGAEEEPAAGGGAASWVS